MQLKKSIQNIVAHCLKTGEGDERKELDLNLIWEINYLILELLKAKCRVRMFY